MARMLVLLDSSIGASDKRSKIPQGEEGSSPAPRLGNHFSSRHTTCAPLSSDSATPATTSQPRAKDHR